MTIANGFMGACDAQQAERDQLQAELTRQIAEYTAKGGTIEHIEAGRDAWRYYAVLESPGSEDMPELTMKKTRQDPATALNDYIVSKPPEKILNRSQLPAMRRRARLLEAVALTDTCAEGMVLAI